MEQKLPVYIFSILEVLSYSSLFTGNVQYIYPWYEKYTNVRLQAHLPGPWVKSVSCHFRNEAVDINAVVIIFASLSTNGNDIYVDIQISKTFLMIWNIFGTG